MEHMEYFHLEKMTQEIKDRKWEVDYSDIQAVVLYPIKSEYWDHMHCNPLHLQMELPPHMENKEEDAAYRRAMEALSDYCFYKGERNTDETVYEGVCQDLSRIILGGV